MEVYYRGWIYSRVNCSIHTIYRIIWISSRSLLCSNIGNKSKAIAIDPNDAKAYNNRGVAYGHKGQHNRAIEDFNKAIALNPDNAGYYHNRAIAYENKGDYKEAIEDYKRIIAIDPNNAMAYNNRGVAYAKRGWGREAVSDFRKACDMGNENGCKNLRKELKKRGGRVKS